MNLYFRMFYMLFLSQFKRNASVFQDFITKHRVWPNDLDILGHVNNGRYFTITDNVRIGWLIQAGIWKEMKKRGYYAVVAGETAQFRKSLMPFQKFEIVSRNMGWDDKFFYVEHQFISKKGIHAIVLVKVMMLGKGNTKVSPHEILSLVPHPEGIPEVNTNESILNWNTSTDLQWKEFKANQSLA